MYGQVDLFSYMAKHNNDNLIPALADGLKKHCQKWDYDFIEKLKKNITAENFIKVFCKITYNYYFEYSDDMYGAKFNTVDLSVKIYKCGKNHEKVLLECPIDDVLKALYSNDKEVEK